MNKASLTKEQEEQEFREKVQAKKKQLEESLFWQQNIKTWRPVYDAKNNLVFFLVLTIFFWSTGYFIMQKTHEIKMTETKVTYSDHPDCRVNEENDEPNICTVEVDVSHKIAAPVYVYYKIDNMYQNHRRYVKSRSYSQLAGKYLTADQLKSDCDPVYRMMDLYPAQQKMINSEAKFDPESPAIPCGLMAKSFFNDTLTFYKKYDKDPKKDNVEFDLNTSDIAWTTDVGKFNNTQDLPKGVESYKDIQWQDMEDPRFIVWMRNAGLPNFRKLYGVINQDIPAGKYTLQVDAQYNVAPFEGNKQFVLSQANVLGGKNEMLYIIYFIAGAITFVMTLGFCFFCVKK